VLTLLVVVATPLGAIGITVIKLQQDNIRTAAFHEMREMGFQTTIGGGAASVTFSATMPPPSQRDLQRLAQLLENWSRAHDLGFSPALNIEQIDLSGTGATDEVVTELRMKFPNAEVRH
jgi:hypothetical protein